MLLRPWRLLRPRRLFRPVRLLRSRRLVRPWRPFIKESCFKRMSLMRFIKNKLQKVFQIRFFRERSEPRLSQEQTSKGVLKLLASEASPMTASEASHPRERSDREPPAGLASRPGAVGAGSRIASLYIKILPLEITASHQRKRLCLDTYRLWFKKQR